MYGSLSHENLISIGLYAFVANDHVHELHDVMEGLVDPGHEDNSVGMQGVVASGFEESLSCGLPSPAERIEDENALSDEDMDFSIEVQREIELLLERQNK